MVATRGCRSVFSWFRHRDINDFTYLLTYLLRMPYSTFLFYFSAKISAGYFSLETNAIDLKL